MMTQTSDPLRHRHLRIIFALCLLFLTPSVDGFVPVSPKKASVSTIVPKHHLVALNLKPDDDKHFIQSRAINLTPQSAWTSSAASASVPVLVVMSMSLPADAATGGAPFSSAIAAYVHYVSLLVMTACVTTERIIVKSGMSQDDQVLLTNADIAYGVSALTLVVSGYYRLVDYGKGFDFYSHEPVFWLKISLVGVLGALSFFPTTKIIQRSIAARQSPDGQYPEMTEELAARMRTILNAELTALASIPLSATIMSRGIGYNDSIPWPVEAAGAALLFLGLGYKYVKEALDFKD